MVNLPSPVCCHAAPLPSAPAADASASGAQAAGEAFAAGLARQVAEIEANNNRLAEGGLDLQLLHAAAGWQQPASGVAPVARIPTPSIQVLP